MSGQTAVAAAVDGLAGGVLGRHPAGRALGRLVVAELHKLTTTRAPRWVAASAVGMTLLALSGAVASGGIPEETMATPDGVRLVLGHGGLAAILALVLGVLATASEHRHGTVVDTLLSEPRRGLVLTAKGTALAVVGERPGWVVGGAQVYEALLDRVSRVEVTDVDVVVGHGVRAPDLDVGWRLLATDPADGGWHTSRTGLRYRFRTLERA